MVGRRRTATRTSNRQGGAAAGEGSDVYHDMLADAGVGARQPVSPESERPPKRRRPIPKDNDTTPEVPADEQTDEDEEEDVEFEDVALPAPTVQTMERESDDDDDDIEFEDIDFTTPLKDDSAPQSTELELNLTAEAATTPTRNSRDRRKPITREEKDRRILIHKAHLVCLLSHVARRNHWCNDTRVQDLLRPHLTNKTASYLTPGTHLPQFGRAESLKKGLEQAAAMWKAKFEVTERGLRRALWAEEAQHLEEYELPNDMESCLDRDDFREAAKKLQGSRDVGAQFYCALLRSVGVTARLVCSLQPLAPLNGPTLSKPKSKNPAPKAKTSKNDKVRAALENYQKLANSNSSPAGPSTARRRLGHPNATAYNFEAPAVPSRPRPTFEAPKSIKESAHPVYWVEVLDVGHQKWQPADPVVTQTFWKPRSLEPPITDKENCMSYVVAFEADGAARDVTRRYAKAYTAKTRRLRVETVAEEGDRWWRKTMKPFRRKWPGDLDQIEDNELAGVEAREPMPRNVQDFKDHPVYALQRHLRRNEVLVMEATPSGTVSAGARGALEKIYRRRDVRIVRTTDKWYRMGREVKPNEIPAKWLPKRARPKGSRFDDREDDDADDAETPAYTLEQTELYEPPPVRNGRVPRNKFGNIDVYVPSMVPRGGVHINHELASRAAYLLGVDYAPALTGFSFRGRHGTAVLSGIVTAVEHEDGIQAVIAGLGDVEREAEDERRRLVAMTQWRRFLMGLRIRERVWGGVDAEERREAEREVDEQMAKDMESDATEEFDMEVDEEEMGGFLVE